MSDKFLSIENLSIEYVTEGEVVKAVNGITLSMKKGETLGLVGETGAGKTTSALAVMRLLPPRTGRIRSGSITVGDVNVLELSEPEMRKLRGELIAMIYQDPMTSLNPVITVGDQILEVLELHKRQSKAEMNARVAELLELVGIPAERANEYPHQFSGGMKQRVVIAMALACEPDILIADEPTTALDVTIQAQILELMQDLQKKLGMAIIMVTHDLGVIASMCDEIMVMYGGRVCERGTADDIFYRPAHEYTKGLLRSIPSAANMNERLIPIGGTPINMLDLPKGCAFCPRCDAAMKICLREQPEELQVSDTHHAACWMNVKKMKEAQ